MVGGSFPGGSVVKNPPANVGDMGALLHRADPTGLRATESVHRCRALTLEPGL